MIAGHLALLDAAVFSGAANLRHPVEQPARFGLDDERCSQSGSRRGRGLAMQAPLAPNGIRPCFDNLVFVGLYHTLRPPRGKDRCSDSDSNANSERRLRERRS